MRLASLYGVCFGAQIRVDIKHFKTTDFDQVLGKLQSQSQSRIVVLFSGKSCAAQLMAASKRIAAKNSKPLIWVGCDGWSSRDVVTTGNIIHLSLLLNNFPIISHGGLWHLTQVQALKLLLKAPSLFNLWSGIWMVSTVISKLYGQIPTSGILGSLNIGRISSSMMLFLIGIYSCFDETKLIADADSS